MDQIRSAKNNTFKVQLELTQPVVEITVINPEREEETKPRFYKKEEFERNPLLWSQQSPAESTLAKYGNLGSSTEDGTLLFKEDCATIYVQHNGRSILNRNRVPVTVGMKGLVYPYDPATKYVSKLCLNFQGCFKYGEVHKTARSTSCPKHPSVTASHEVMHIFNK